MSPSLEEVKKFMTLIRTSLQLSASLTPSSSNFWLAFVSMIKLDYDEGDPY